MKVGIHSLTALMCTILIAACSGSDGGSVSPLPPSSGMAKIDDVNAAPIAGQVADTVLASDGFGDLVDGRTGLQVARMDDGLQKTRGYAASVPIPATTIACDISGEVTVSGNVADPATLSAGDNLMFRFSDCDDGEGQVLNEAFEFGVNRFSDDSAQGLVDLNATLNFDGLEITEGQDVTSLVGDAELNLDTTMPPVTRSSVSGASLTVSENTDTVTLTQFRSDFAYDEGVAPQAFTVAASGMLASTLFEGSVDYSTPIPFMGFAGEHPFSGELLVRGADGASVRLIALDNVNVRLEIDPGDGSGVITQDTTWDGLSVEMSVSSIATGVYGQVLMGPIVPGPETPGQVNEAPFSALFSVLRNDGSIAGRFQSDDDGQFEIDLRPGDYTVVPDASAPFPNPEGQTRSVTVPEQGYAEVILRFDTGIR